MVNEVQVDPVSGMEWWWWWWIVAKIVFRSFLASLLFTFHFGFVREIPDVIKRSFLQCNFLCHSIMLPFRVAAQQNVSDREHICEFMGVRACLRYVYLRTENKSNFQVFKEKLCSHCVTRSFFDDIANLNEQKPDRTSRSNSARLNEKSIERFRRM